MNDNNKPYNNRINKITTGYIGYVFSSALGLFEEPKEYGPMRLLFAAEKAIELFEELGLCNELLKQLLVTINENKEFLLLDYKSLEKFIEKESIRLSRRVKEI